MNHNYSQDKKYFLIKKEIMYDVKKEINYDLIIQILSKANFNKNLYSNNDKRQKLFILKNFPEENYDDYFSNDKGIEKRYKDFISPNEISIIIPNTQNETIHIYDNFEIIEELIAYEFVSGVYETTENYYGLGHFSYSHSTTSANGKSYIECTLKDGKVIVNYPKEKFNNNKYVYSIGYLDNENTFKAEYLLIYRKSHAYFDDIKNK